MALPRERTRGLVHHLASNQGQQGEGEARGDRFVVSVRHKGVSVVRISPSSSKAIPNHGSEQTWTGFMTRGTRLPGHNTSCRYVG